MKRHDNNVTNTKSGEALLLSSTMSDATGALHVRARQIIK